MLVCIVTFVLHFKLGLGSMAGPSFAWPILICVNSIIDSALYISKHPSTHNTPFPSTSARTYSPTQPLTHSYSITRSPTLPTMQVKHAKIGRAMKDQRVGFDKTKPGSQQAGPSRPMSAASSAASTHWEIRSMVTSEHRYM